MNLSREIRRELKRLRRQYRWELAHGFIKDPTTGLDLYRMCSTTAAIFVWEFGGKLTGYLHQRGPRPNNSAVIVAKGLGHDFCLIDGRWLVDFWAWTGHCLPFRERDLYDLQNPRDDAIVDYLYGDRSTWMDTYDTYMNGCGLDVLGDHLGIVRRIGYSIVINGGLPLTERIAHANRMRGNKYAREMGWSA